MSKKIERCLPQKKKKVKNSSIQDLIFLEENRLHQLNLERIEQLRLEADNKKESQEVFNIPDKDLHIPDKDLHIPDKDLHQSGKNKSKYKSRSKHKNKSKKSKTEKNTELNSESVFESISETISESMFESISETMPEIQEIAHDIHEMAHEIQEISYDVFISEVSIANISDQEISETIFYDIAPESVPENISESVPENISESVPENTSESVPENALQSVPEIALQSVPENTSESVPENALQSVPEIALQSVPEIALQSVPEIVPESARHSVPESARHSVPESTLQSIAENIPESNPKNVPESNPENVPKSNPENVPESITEKSETIPKKSSKIIKDINVYANEYLDILLDFREVYKSEFKIIKDYKECYECLLEISLNKKDYNDILFQFSNIFKFYLGNIKVITDIIRLYDNKHVFIKNAREFLLDTSKNKARIMYTHLGINLHEYKLIIEPFIVSEPIIFNQNILLDKLQVLEQRNDPFIILMEINFNMIMHPKEFIISKIKKFTVTCLNYMTTLDNTYNSIQYILQTYTIEENDIYLGTSYSEKINKYMYMYRGLIIKINEIENIIEKINNINVINWLFTKLNLSVKEFTTKHTLTVLDTNTQSENWLKIFESKQ